MKTPDEWKPHLEGAGTVDEVLQNAQLLTEWREARKVAPKGTWFAELAIYNALHTNNSQGRPRTPRTAGRAVRRVMEGGGMFPYTPQEVARILSEKLVVALEKVFPLITVTWPDGTEEDVTVRSAVERAKEGSTELLALVVDEIEAAARSHEDVSNHMIRVLAAARELLKRANEGNL